MKSFQPSLRLILLCASLVAPASLASAQDTSESGSELTDPSTEQSAGDETPAVEAEEVEEEAADAEEAATTPPPDAVETTASDDSSAAPAAPVDAEEAPPAPAAQPSPFRSSLFSWQHGLSVNSMNPEAQLTYNPTYYQSFFLQPRYYIDRQNFLVLSLSAMIELTDNDISAIEREFQFGDVVLEWRHTEAWEGFIFIPSVRLAAPTSNPSIAADRVVNTGVGLTVVRVFPELASLTFAATGGYRHWWATSNTAGTAPGVQGYPCSGPGGGPATCDQVSAFTTERDRLFAALTVTVMPFPGLTVLTQYAAAWIYGNDTTPIEGVPSQSPTQWRNGHYWTLAVGYDVLPWLNVQLGYQGSPGFTPWLNESGNVQNPFYYYDSEIYLSGTVMLDGLVEEIIGGDEEELTPEQLQRRRQGLASRGASLGF